MRQIRRYQFHFAALFDADEFLVLKTDKFDNVVDFMDHYCPKAVVDIQSKTIYTGQGMSTGILGVTEWVRESDCATVLRCL